MVSDSVSLGSDFVHAFVYICVYEIFSFTFIFSELFVLNAWCCLFVCLFVSKKKERTNLEIDVIRDRCKSDEDGEVNDDQNILWKIIFSIKKLKQKIFKT